MVDVVVFGTGSTGERAWRAASTLPDINVVCFADNDTRKHGARLHERPIVGPNGLTDARWDFIVLASMYAADIERQLLGLGVAPDAVVTPDPNAFADVFSALPARKRAATPIALGDGTSVLERDLPRVLVVTGAMLNLEDEDRLPVEALLQAFPLDKLVNVCRSRAGRPWLDRTVVLPAGSDATAAKTLARELASPTAIPDLVFAPIRCLDDLTLLDVVLAGLPPGIPVVRYALDCRSTDVSALAARLAGVPAAGSEIWAAGPELARAIARGASKNVPVVAPWTRPAIPAAPRDHRPGDAGIRVVMVGGLPQPQMLPIVRRVWARCRASRPGLPPIQWHASASTVQSAIDAGSELGDDIVWRGSSAGAALHSRLADADVALLPINTGGGATPGGASYFLPPRMPDVCASGLPVFAIAGEGSEMARHLQTWRHGITAAGPYEAAIAARLLELIDDRTLRSELGARARAAAEAGFAQAPRLDVLGRLVTMARAFTRPEQWQPRQEGLVRLAGSERVASARLEDVLTDRIHYACGRNVLAGWLNVDGYDESFPSGEVPAAIAGTIFRLDLTGRHPFPDDHFRLGYSEDFIEHIDQAEFVSFLCECFRTFQPGGVLRLSTPGLEGVLRRHLRGSGWQAASVLREEAYERWWHKHFLCFAEVEAIARHIGWRDVRAAPYGESAIPDLRQDTRPSQADLNLVVELVK